jgi:signal transduction histidine kinase
VYVDVDALHLQRVVTNFLSNALKYAPSRTDIVIAVDVAPARARVSVHDAGPGIRPQELVQVFEKYHRASDVRCEGTGLGLFVSKQIVEAHAGTIGVDSLYGGGSSFFFELRSA